VYNVSQTFATNYKEMNLTINSRQKAIVKIFPSYAGKPLVLKGKPSWIVASGKATVTPEKDGLSASIVSNGVGSSTIRVETDATDLGLASDSCVVEVTEAKEKSNKLVHNVSGTNPPGFDQFGNRLPVDRRSGTVSTLSRGRPLTVEGPVHVDSQGRYIDQNGNVLENGQFIDGMGNTVNAPPVSVDNAGRYVEGARYTDELGRSMGGPVHTDSAGRTVDEGGRVIDGPGRLVHDPVYQDRSGRFVDVHGHYVDSAGHLVRRSEVPLPIAVGPVHVDNVGRTVDSTGQVILEAGRTVDASGRYIGEFVTGPRVHNRSGRAHQVGNGVPSVGNYNLGLSVIEVTQK
jgi:hypothetical protein